MINLKVIFPEIVPNTFDQYKIHFAIGGEGRPNDAPLKAFYINKFDEFQNWQRRGNFNQEYIISFMFYKKNQWIFAGLYKRISYKKFDDGHYEYETELLEKHQEYIGRLMVSYEHTREAVRILQECYDDIKFLGILPKRKEIEDFPGYENLNIYFPTLKYIIDNEIDSWRATLSNAHGVYLITDHNNCKLYVGAAYGKDAFWNRWKEYVTNGSGGNVKLKEIIDKNGFDYTSNFSFSILEVHFKQTDKNFILQRENYWKEILLTRKKEIGYNCN